jgi:hypothetical protein
MPLRLPSSFRGAAVGRRRIGLLRSFALYLVLALTIGGGLLAAFEGSDHHLHVLPADASLGGVVPAAFFLAAVATLIEQKLRAHHRPSPNPEDTHPE